MIPNWNPKRPKWTEKTKELLPKSFNDHSNGFVTLSTLLNKSDNFICGFPIDINRCKVLKEEVDARILERNINSAYPIIHENILNLCAKFILFKQKYGNLIEKKLYNTMDLIQFINRLLTKRAVTFVGTQDFYILLHGVVGFGSWITVGTPLQKEMLTLENCLSYDEIKLSAFLSISSYTYFINDGNRRNCGIPAENRSNIQDEGVIIGIIGPRLTKEEVMEYQEIILSDEQNCEENGYGKCNQSSIHRLFAEFYEEKCLTFDQIPIDQLGENLRYIPLKNKHEIFDNHFYCKRLIFSIDTLFIEANQRALERAKMAYIHVVGFGLGVWAKTETQDKVFLEICAQRIHVLGPKLKHVSDICFAYINKHNSCGGFKNGDKIPIDDHPNQGIKIQLRNREPHTRLTGDDSDKLLVVSYAWDGNALPGNEYWNNHKDDSSDSAAASSTQISELQNPFINPKVCAENLRVVTKNSVLTLKEYVQKINSNNSITDHVCKSH